MSFMFDETESRVFKINFPSNSHSHVYRSPGHFYCGQCKCDPTVKHLCTPACQAHMEIHHGAVISVAYLKATQDLVFRQGNKIFRQRLKGVNPEKRLFPCISLRAAKCRIFKEEGDHVLENG